MLALGLPPFLSINHKLFLSIMSIANHRLQANAPPRVLGTKVTFAYFVTSVDNRADCAMR